MRLDLTAVLNAIADVVFSRRRAWLALFALVTAGLGYSAGGLRVDAAFNKMVPLEHPYMKVFTQYQQTFGGANRVIVALRQRQGDIFNPAFFQALKQVTDEVFFIPGVDRATVTSLFTPNTRFIEIVEEGFAGGNVIPADFRGTPADLAKVRVNVLKSGGVGRLVANDFKGALVRAELLEVDPVSGARLDYQEVARRLETIRARFETGDLSVHIVGFAKAVGDIADGARGVIAFFGVAFVITALLLYWYSNSLRVTAIALLCALLPVAWLLGLLPLLGYGMDPMSILVPFLIFAIGVSHAAQMTHAWKLEVLAGRDSPAAARAAFQKLIVPGTVALLTDALGFLVIMHIKIEIVRELGVTASLGVALMIVTNKLLLPILLSHASVSDDERRRAAAREERGRNIWPRLARLARPRPAALVLAVAAAALMLGVWKAQGLRIGDLGTGIPELRDSARYNRDSAVVTDRFTIGVDVLAVIAQTRDVPGACTNYEVMDAIDRFEWHLRQVDGVQSVLALTTLAKIIHAGWNEGSLKWRALPRNPLVLAQSVTPVDTSSGLLNTDCSAMQVLIFARDHRGDTIARIVRAIKAFAAANDSERLQFLLASGNVGVMAATNEAVDAAEETMLVSIFGALILFCLVTFRSWRAAACILLPLVLASVLCEALMAGLGIGLKVSTLPVIALGVGIGVDYGIYLYERMQHELEQNAAGLTDAFAEALRQRGTAVLFTALTMSVGVGSWAFSALKFQADMGLLLAFMFLVNMLGAILLLPALAAFLLRPGTRRAG
ncbi:MAG: transporter [Candidatus Muproteobacteria bacterium RIFCSPHIGHO2_01_FULL_65_16]|uniref:Transporter n=1 Tax=Candidatus Muproteobacteria bacterium RIFCSPHIGHO2_01_FULL_65_16 TaxID=1817764 RepID=A0A1F6TM42_9PROT|nr:MAG: transporter [Candidatus Muproteobacteria bacterium RIFCSPHIGHO2_01_FULL_65_16]